MKNNGKATLGKVSSNFNEVDIYCSFNRKLKKKPQKS